MIRVTDKTGALILTSSVVPYVTCCKEPTRHSPRLGFFAALTTRSPGILLHNGSAEGASGDKEIVNDVRARLDVLAHH